MKKRVVFFLCFISLWSVSSFAFSEYLVDVETFYISEIQGNPTTTNGDVSHFMAVPSTYDISWIIDTSRCYVTHENGDLGGTLSEYELFVVFKNIKINKTSHPISALADHFPLQTEWAVYTVNGFTLQMPAPIFETGSSLNIPCYINTAQISISDYINTDGLDSGLVITDEFEWTLPSGWQTSDFKSGTFVDGSSINITVPTATSNENITIRAKAYEQYSNYGTLQVTRNIGEFYITGNTNVNCRQTYQYSTQYYPGVSYSWQLPAGWSGSSNTNTINATVNGTVGNIIVTATACGQTDKDTFEVLNTKIIPDNASLEGSDLLCSIGSTYVVNNLFNYSSVSWGFGDNIHLESSSSNSALLKAISNGTGYIIPTINTICGSEAMNTKNIWVGSPDLDNITVYYSEDITGNYPDEFCPGDANELLARANPLIDMKLSSIYWDMGSWDVYNYDDEGYVLFEIPLSFNEYESVYYEVSNNCDVAISSTTLYEGICGGYFMVVSPNPSSSETTLVIEATIKEEPIDLNEEWDLEVYDQQQNLKEKFQKIKGNKKVFNISNWKEGHYLLRVKYKDKFIFGRLIVSKI